MEKYLVFILLTLFFNNWITPASGCELDSDCIPGLYCCKQIKSCRFSRGPSCDDGACSSDRDCGGSLCCSRDKYCTNVRGSCSSGLSAGIIFVIVFVPLGFLSICICLIIAHCAGSGGNVSGGGGGGGFWGGYGGGGDCGGGGACGGGGGDGGGC